MWNWHAIYQRYFSIYSKLLVHTEPKIEMVCEGASQADWIFPVPSATDALITFVAC